MLIPTTRYRDCEVALGFLRDVLGLSEVAVHRDADGQIVHGELALDGGMFLFGPEMDNDFGKLMTAPGDIGGRVTSTVYMIVQDVAAHHSRAVAAGADVVQPLYDTGRDGAEYSLRDPGGHIWSIGSYDPRPVNGGKM